MEKVELSVPVDPMMDRELQNELPRLQVGFCDGVCLPVYRALATLCPALNPMEKAVILNRDMWAKLADNNNDDDKEESGTKITRNL